MSEIDGLGIEGLENARLAGEGGFGRVFVATQPRFRREVAVKLMDAKVTDERSRIRFERECTALGLLGDHPNIVTVYDSGFDDQNHPYIVMGYLEGGSYADRMETFGQLPWREVLEIGVKIAGAVETAHRAGILHRDIKPENVLRSSYGEPTLADFGIARLDGGPTATATGKVTTSIAHAAPEVLEGGEPSPTWDVYALGSTLFTLLRGQTAFVRDTDDSFIAALKRIAHDPVPDLRPHGVPDDLSRIVETAMAKDPAGRYQSALGLGRALQTTQRAHGETVTPLVVPDEPPTVRTDAPFPVAPTVPQQAFASPPPLPPGGFGSAGTPAAAGAPPYAPAATGTQPYAPQPYPAAQPYPGYASHPQRRGVLIALVALGAVVLVGASIGVIALTGGGEDAPPVPVVTATEPGGDGGDPPPPPPGPGDTTTVLLPGRPVTGELTDAQPAVRYRIDGAEGQGLVVSMTGDDDLDPFLRLLSAEGGELASDDDGGDGLDAHLEATLPRAGSYFVEAGSFQSLGRGSFTLTLDPAAVGVRGEQEPPLQPGETREGSIEQGGQRLRYPIQLTGGTTVVIDVRASGDGSLDPQVSLLGPDGGEVASDDDGGEGLNSRLETAVPADGVYTVTVNGFTSSTGSFSVTVSTP